MTDELTTMMGRVRVLELRIKTMTSELRSMGDELLGLYELMVAREKQRLNDARSISDTMSADLEW